MRIVHFADLHLGVETYGRIDPGTGLSTRLHDVLAGLDQLVDFALNSDVDLVLFCGDAYKSRDPSQTYQREFARRIQQLSSAGIPVFLLVGNHDMPNSIGRATSVEIFQTLSIPNVTVANRLQTYRIAARRGTLQIVALPWARRSALLSREELKNLASDEINQRLEDMLTHRLNSEISDLDPALPAIMAGHLAHSGAVPGSEKSMMMGRDYVLLQSTVANPAFDYVGLGHMHNRQVLEYPVPTVYSGSLQTIDFGDEGQEKGFYLLHLDERARRGDRLKAYEFQTVTSRRFVTIKVDADTDDPMASVLRAVARADIENAIVRVQVSLPAAKDRLIRDAEIRKALSGAYVVAAVSKDVKREYRGRLGSHTAETLRPLEALELYLEQKKTTKARTQLLLEYAQRLVRQESSDA
jgi:exonuclease SbcD